MTTLYRRPSLTDLDRAQVVKTMRRFNRPRSIFLTLILSKLLFENLRLLKIIKVLRDKRSLTPTNQDQDIKDNVNTIETYINTGKKLKALELSLFENIRLTVEVNEHRGALGLPLIKTYKVVQ